MSFDDVGTIRAQIPFIFFPYNLGIAVVPWSCFVFFFLTKVLLLVDWREFIAVEEEIDS